MNNMTGSVTVDDRDGFTNFAAATGTRTNIEFDVYLANQSANSFIAHLIIIGTIV